MKQPMLMIDLDHGRHGGVPPVGLGGYCCHLLFTIPIKGIWQRRLLSVGGQRTANCQQYGQGYGQARMHRDSPFGRNPSLCSWVDATRMPVQTTERIPKESSRSCLFYRVTSCFSSSLTTWKRARNFLIFSARLLPSFLSKPLHIYWPVIAKPLHSHSLPHAAFPRRKRARL